MNLTSYKYTEYNLIMTRVLKFDEYSSDGKSVNEGLLSSFIAKGKITKIQGAVFTKVSELIEKDPEKYKDAKTILDAIENDAKKLYNKELGDMIKNKDVINANEWWRDFAPKAEEIITQDIS